MKNDRIGVTEFCKTPMRFIIEAKCLINVPHDISGSIWLNIAITDLIHGLKDSNIFIIGLDKYEVTLCKQLWMSRYGSSDPSFITGNMLGILKRAVVPDSARRYVFVYKDSTSINNPYIMHLANKGILDWVISAKTLRDLKFHSTIDVRGCYPALREALTKSSKISYDDKLANRRAFAYDVGRSLIPYKEPLQRNSMEERVKGDMSEFLKYVAYDGVVNDSTGWSNYAINGTAINVSAAQIANYTGTTVYGTTNNNNSASLNVEQTDNPIGIPQSELNEMFGGLAPMITHGE